MKPDVIIFDLFGTLVNVGIQRHPYRQLLKWARDNGRKPLSDDARTIMTIDGDIRRVADHMSIPAPEKLLVKLIHDIDCELASLTLFEDVIPLLDELQAYNIRMAICSNLAAPYGKVIARFFSWYSLDKYLSYECGFIKPEVEIYQSILSRMKVEPEQCLFIGDTYIADVWGPQQIGMKSIHLCRTDVPGENSMANLALLMDIIS
jgi:FMN phosphatase YigB (HAD superfamily)